jgi:hypothetical protein
MKKMKKIIVFVVFVLVASSLASATSYSPSWWTGTNGSTTGNPNEVWQLDRFCAPDITPSTATPSNFTRAFYTVGSTYDTTTWSGDSLWPHAFAYAGHSNVSSVNELALIFYKTTDGVDKAGHHMSLTFVAPVTGTYLISGSVDYCGIYNGAPSYAKGLDVIVFKSASGTWTRSDQVTYYSNYDTSVNISPSSSHYYSGNAALPNGVELNAGDYITFRPWAWDRGYFYQANMDDIVVTEMANLPVTEFIIPIDNDSYVRYSEFTLDENYGDDDALYPNVNASVRDVYLQATTLCDVLSRYKASNEIYSAEFVRYIKLGGTVQAQCYTVLNEWNQNDLTWNNQPYDISNPEITGKHIVDIIENGQIGWRSDDISSAVKDWVSDPNGREDAMAPDANIYPNYGFRMRVIYGGSEYHSSECADSGNSPVGYLRPYIKVKAIGPIIAPDVISIPIDNDSFVAEDQAAINFNANSTLESVYNNAPYSTGHRYIFAQASTLLSNLSGYEPNDIAQAFLWSYQYYGMTGSGDIAYVNGPWNETTITWGNMPGLTDTGYDFRVSTAGGWQIIDITNEVKTWLSGTIANYGLVFKVWETPAGNQQQHWYTSEDSGVSSSPAGNRGPIIQVHVKPINCNQVGTFGFSLAEDFNKDCKVDFFDFAEFAGQWLSSVDPTDQGYNLN